MQVGTVRIGWPRGGAVSVDAHRAGPGGYLYYVREALKQLMRQFGG